MIQLDGELSFGRKKQMPVHDNMLKDGCQAAGRKYLAGFPALSLSVGIEERESRTR